MSLFRRIFVDPKVEERLRNYRPPRRKRCHHFDAVSRVCQDVVAGRVPPSDLGTKTLAEEYLDLHLEFEALRTHLGGER